MRKKGFSLVEVMVTVAIIAILSAIVMAGLGIAQAKGRDTKRISDIKQLQGAIENYFDSCYTYPPSNASNDISSFSNTDCSGNTFLDSIPTDPLTSAAYSYYNPNTSNPLSKAGFHLCATLEYPYLNQGKAGKGPLASGDPCDGTNSKVFDVTGGTY